MFRRIKTNLAKTFIAAILSVLILSTSGGQIAYADVNQETQNIIGNSSLAIDLQHNDNGILRAKAEPSTKKLKLILTIDGNHQMTFDQNMDGEWQTYTLIPGNKSYTLELYKNTTGRRYVLVSSQRFDFDLGSNEIWLQPNEYVKYSNESKVIELADTVCHCLQSDMDKFNAIRNYIRRSFALDYFYFLGLRDNDYTAYDKYKPEIEHLLETKLGVCKDFSGLAVAMLRLQGIPSALVYGYADNQSHTWVVAKINGTAVLYDPSLDITGCPAPESYSIQMVH